MWLRSSILTVFPSSYPRSQWQSLEWLALFALILFALTGIISPDLGRKAEWMLLAATLMSAPHIRRNDPNAWLYLVMFGLFALMLIGNWLVYSYDDASLSANNHYSRDMLRLFWLIPVGWWLGGRERNALLLLGIATIGLYLAAAWKGGGLQSWQQLIQGKQTDFNLLNAQHTGVLFGTVLLGASTLVFRFLNSTRYRIALITIWAGVFLSSLLIVFGVQTLQTWVGLATAGIVAFFYFIKRINLEKIKVRAFTAILIICGMAVVGLMLLNPTRSLTVQVEREFPTIRAALVDDFDTVPLNSTTIRLLQWRLALSTIAERPLLGHGGGTRPELIQQSSLPDRIKADFGHFHNSYLELWLAHGLLGPLIFIGILAGLAWRIFLAQQRDLMANDLALFGYCWIAFFAVNNMFESYVSYRSGIFLMLIVSGALYTLAASPNKPARVKKQLAEKADTVMLHSSQSI